MRGTNERSRRSTAAARSSPARPSRASAGAGAYTTAPAMAASLAVAGVALAATAACAQRPAADAEEAMNALTQEERAAGWRLLFDGETTDGWRGFRMESMPPGWEVVDGTLTRVASGGDIITVEQFEDFELALEWKVEPGGNSGVMYRVTEGADRTYETGPEMQVLDDAAHPDGRSRLTAAGAIYGLYASPEGVVEPAGEWNRARVVVDDGHLEHWLNGTKVAEAELGSADWERRVRDSKFAQWPGFGRAARGHIALQDHGDRVAYRNIRIRELPSDGSER